MSRRVNFALLVATVLFTLPLHAENPCKPENTVMADVVALDEAFYNNRLGTFQSGGMIFALRRDVVTNAGAGYDLTPGHVMLRPSKRPRPIVLRMNAGDCLDVRFQNLLADTMQVFHTSPPVPWNGSSQMTAADPSQANNPINSYGSQFIQPATRWAGVHVMGLQPVKAWDESGAEVDPISADGSWAGRNDITANIATAMRASGLVRPGAKMRYLVYAPPQSEGSYLLYSTASNNGVSPTYGGQLMQGLFGAVTVQPKEGEYYRSQVTRDELWAATYKSAGQTLTSTSQTVTIHGQSAKVKKWKGMEVVVLDEDGNPAASGGLHTPDGQPLINYQAVDASGTPILRMTKGTAPREIVHSDLTAIITGKNAGYVTFSPYWEPEHITPEPHQPWREFAIHYHDDFAATQAFSEMVTGPLQSVFVAGQDLFAINYGMGGIGAEILANRIKLGPQANCAACMYEEFFLSSWAVGDPAMVVDRPANDRQHRATKALYPDDPSNVYHSYVGDHVIFQILHAGTNITHVHHMHAQQWLHSPRNSFSAYRDSQMISPGASFTLNHVYNGSGNVNKTIGDSIFHCHFYPHFAQGMWAMWRVHDMFEEGTKLDADGRPVAGWNRALPDGEIAVGTPTPALVPLPKIAMPLIPARVRLVPVNVPANGNTPVGYMTEVEQDAACKKPEDKTCKNPGYPFFVPGVAGQRAPHPPLDFAWDTVGGKKVLLDGGLPRHLALWDTDIVEVQNRWDFTKTNHNLTTVELPEEGTFNEQVAMKFTSHRNAANKPFWPSFTPSGTPKGFEVNGLPSRHGAPYANPNRRLDGTQQCKEEPEDQVPPVLDPEHGEQPCLIRYKAADIQIDAVFNKAGWHFPQTRLLSLWGDVKATTETKRMPEPFFFRANSGQIIEYWHSNLVPEYYELDDFQVRTPTDVIGQHIHLVKFDVTSSDGAGNGYNYEDGTLSPQIVRHWIEATNHGGGIYPALSISSGVGRPTGTQTQLTPKTIPYFGDGPQGAYRGAQATIQRWSADPVIAGPQEFSKRNADPAHGHGTGKDLTLRTVFTHDHFGPSTHQQAGLYAGLLVEPTHSVWLDGQQAGVHYGSNQGRPNGDNGQPPLDGGPTGWQANIINRDKESDSYREFALEFADTQLAYTADSRRHASDYKDGKNPNYTGWADPAHAIGAPGNPLAGSASCSVPSGPTPELISNLVPTGTYSVNYRNEPLSLRLSEGTAKPTHPTREHATDPSFAFASTYTTTNPPATHTLLRNIDKLNSQPALGTQISSFNDFKYPGPFTGAQPTDPYTPLLRAYDGDKVQVRTLVGAHLSPHFFNFHGVNWLFEPQESDAGWRSAQGMGISEHYEMLFYTPRGSGPTSDYLYETTSDTLGRKNGNWGILRSYRDTQHDLVRLPNNKSAADNPPAGCPSDAPRRAYKVRAVRIQDVMAKTAAWPNGQPLFYNTRGQAGQNGGQQLVDPYAIIYVDEADLDANGLLKNQQRVEPLILRASAGECVEVSLSNHLPAGNTSQINPNFTAGFPVTAADATTVNNWITALSGNNGCTKAFYTTEFQAAFNSQNPYGYSLPDSTQTSAIRWNCVIPQGSTACAPNCPAGTPTAPANECSSTIALTGSPTQTFYVGRDPYDAKRVWVQATQPVSVTASSMAGLHASLLPYDIRKSDGMNVGQNPTQSIEPGGSAKYEWFAGRYQQNAETGKWHSYPIEYGSVNLNPSDPLLQHPRGLLGALIIEPYKATWKTDTNSKASARVHYTTDGKERWFREFVAVIQDDVTLEVTGAAGTTPQTTSTTNASGLLGNWTRAFNYKTEPMGYRYINTTFLQNTAPNAPSGVVRAQSDQLTLSDPQTPVFAAAAGEAVRIRMLHPAGLNEQVLHLYGHGWEEEPYVVGKGGPWASAGPNGVPSAILGHNRLSQRLGSRDSFGPNISWDLLIGEYTDGSVRDGAGGVARTTGDYMFRTFIGSDFFDGLWGILRVGEPNKDIVTVTYYTNGSDTRFPAGVKGTVTANTSNGETASKVEIWRGTAPATGSLVEIVNVDQQTGGWTSAANVAPPIFVRSACTANCTPIGPWGSVTMHSFIPTTGDPKQESNAASAPAAAPVKQTAPVDQFRKEVNPPVLPPMSEQ